MPDRITRKGPSRLMDQAQVCNRVNQARAAADAGQQELALSILSPQLLDSLDQIPPERARGLLLSVAGVFHRARRLELAERYYLAALRSGPDVMAYVNLGHICHFTGRLAEAIQWRSKAVALCPDDPRLGADLGTSLIFIGRKQEGIELLAKAAACCNDPGICSLYLMNLHYMPELDCRFIFEQHRQWASRYAPDSGRRQRSNRPATQRRLRVGYISADFRTHPVASFLEPLLDGHDRSKFEVFGYGSVACPDRLTWRLQAKFDTYRAICNLDDQAVAGMIEEDGIDVLVDLSGHTSGNRLGVLALRPAPVQMTYLGYPDTTGMDQIDYRIADSLSTPQDQQPYYTERLVHLPAGFLCYMPPDLAPQPGPPPCLANSSVTFASVSDTAKLNVPLLRIWSEIMAAVPGSRFLLKSRAGGDPLVKQILLDRCAEAGMDPGRVCVVGQMPAIEYWQMYSRIDIVLDSYPYNGTATTCDALWMGVPVISLCGRHHASRVGLSILSAIGLPSLAPRTADQYKARAVALARSPRLLEGLRRGLRGAISASTLGNAKAFARTVESAYRDAWDRWCSGR